MKRVLLESDILFNISNNIYLQSDIINYINEIIVNNNLSDDINEVLITKLDNNMGSYNETTKTFKINYDNIIYHARFEYALKPNNLNINTFINLKLLNVIAHELTHILQNKENNNIFMLENKYLNENYNVYLKNHELFAFERDAKVNALENIIELIKKYNLGIDFYNYFLNELKNVLLAGYSVFKNPNKRINGLSKAKLSILKDDVYTKMKYGLKISYKEFIAYKKNGINLLNERFA